MTKPNHEQTAKLSNLIVQNQLYFSRVSTQAHDFRFHVIQCMVVRNSTFVNNHTFICQNKERFCNEKKYAKVQNCKFKYMCSIENNFQTVSNEKYKLEIFLAQIICYCKLYKLLHSTGDAGKSALQNEASENAVGGIERKSTRAWATEIGYNPHKLFNKVDDHCFIAVQKFS